MLNPRPKPPRPDRIRSIQGSFSWIDHRFLRQGFDQGLTRLEKLLYLVLVAVSNQDGVSFYSDQRLGELLDIRFPHELAGARRQLVARDLIAFEAGLYQVLQLPARSAAPGQLFSKPRSEKRFSRPGPFSIPDRTRQPLDPASSWKSLQQLLDLIRRPAALEERSRDATHDWDG